MDYLRENFYVLSASHVILRHHMVTEESLNICDLGYSLYTRAKKKSKSQPMSMNKSKRILLTIKQTNKKIRAKRCRAEDIIFAAQWK